jgi:hypothetical protein
VTLSARWVTLRARWVTLRARWVTLRGERVVNVAADAGAQQAGRASTTRHKWEEAHIQQLDSACSPNLQSPSLFSTQKQDWILDYRAVWLMECVR